jgi:hypothetical protein
MRKRVTWFVIGFVVSWLTWSIIGYVRLRPRDYTKSWSTDQRDAAPAWLKHAKGRRLGGIMVFTPPDVSPSCALIHPPKPDHFPQILLQDEDSDGFPDSLLIADRLSRSFLICDADADGIFDSMQYSTRGGTNSVSISDDNMDGIPDIRLGPGRSIAVTIDGVWHDLVHIDKKQYVKLGEGLTQVKSIDDTWQVIEE